MIMFFPRILKQKVRSGDAPAGRTPRRAAVHLRSMPSWLAFSPWIVVAGSLLLALMVLLMDYRGGDKESAVATRIFLERGTSLIHAYEATLQAGMGFQWTDEELQALLDKIGTSPDIHYIAVTDEQGRVLAASDTRLVNSDLVGPEEMEELAPSRRARGHIVNLAGETPIFQVYQLLSVRQYEERLRRHGHMMMSRRMMRSSSGAARIPNQRLTIFVGYDMTPLLEAESADARRALIHWSVLAFIGAAGLLTLFLVKGYQRSRLLVQETSAFTFALLDTLPLGLVAVDQANRVTSINPEAERITGLKGGDVLGRDISEALPGLWTALNETGVMEEHGEERHVPREQEVRCVFGDGRRVPLALTATPVAVPSRNGRNSGYAFILRDLGEIRRLQAEIRRQDRLAALGHMAAGIAHEIRNPLSAIKGLARFFREISPEGGEEARVAGIMTQEVQRLDRVVGDLLELARPDKLNLTGISPALPLERAANLVRANMDKLGIRYTQEVPSPCPEVMLDADRMTQVLLNLFLNAIQAMPGGGTLTTRIRFQSRSGEEDAPGSGDILLLDIEDTGEGIPKDKIHQIFSPYYTTKARGTGLGLSLVQKIVEAHDGEIEVASTVGKGTRFTLHLPLPAAAREEHHDK